MYAIEKTSYGLKMMIAGDLSPEEFREMTRELSVAMSAFSDKISVLLDCRELIAMSPEAQQAVVEFETAFAAEGRCKRLAMIINSPVVGNQSSQITHLAGSNSYKRIISTHKCPGWEQVAMDWILHGKEPGENPVTSKTMKIPTAR